MSANRESAVTAIRAKLSLPMNTRAGWIGKRAIVGLVDQLEDACREIGALQEAKERAEGKLGELYRRVEILGAIVVGCHCSQCGGPFHAQACGPTHASISAALLPGKPGHLA